MSAEAREQTDSADIERGIGIFSRVCQLRGLAGWGVDRVTGDARLRLFKAVVGEHILDPGEDVEVRVAVQL